MPVAHRVTVYRVDGPADTFRLVGPSHLAVGRAVDTLSTGTGMPEVVDLWEDSGHLLIVRDGVRVERSVYAQPGATGSADDCSNEPHHRLRRLGELRAADHRPGPRNVGPGAEMAALVDVLGAFAEKWRGALTVGSIARHLNCEEAVALATLLGVTGEIELADRCMAGHREGDEHGGAHDHP